MAEDLYWMLGKYSCPVYTSIVADLVEREDTIKVLDAGCGPNGSVNLACLGLDVNRAYAKRFSAKNSVVLGSITHLPFKNKAFSLTICQDVLEHVQEKEQSLSELARVSNCIVGSTTNLLNPILMLDTWMPRLLAPIAEKYAGHHCERHSRFTPATLARTLKKAGFNLIEIILIGVPLFKPWIYHYPHYKQQKIPWFAHIWVLLNRLPLKFLRESMVFKARL